ncbi:MAG: RNA polymerase sigma factor SigZ [Kofleriaceae bacterium]
MGAANRGQVANHGQYFVPEMGSGHGLGFSRDRRCVVRASSETGARRQEHKPRDSIGYFVAPRGRSLGCTISCVPFADGPSSDPMGLHAIDGAGTLWDAFAAPLRSFIAKRTPPGTEVDDVVQEVFLRIHESLPDLRDNDRMDAWIFRIARNILADAYRGRQRHHSFAERVTDDELLPEPDLERNAVAELTACLAPMIAQLPAPYREAIELTELQGLTQIEASQRAGISLSGMKSRVQRGRERLKEIVLACCAVDLDVRGGVTECEPRPGGGCGDWVRPSNRPADYMGMTNTNANEAKPSEPTTKIEDATAGCCGGPAPAGASACCALDAEKKASGAAGCGCETKSETPAKKGCC